MKVNLNLDVSSTKPNWHQRKQTLRLEFTCMGFGFSELGLAYKTRSKLEANNQLD